jgi:hypothetical protein
MAFKLLASGIAAFVLLMAVGGPAAAAPAAIKVTGAEFDPDRVCDARAGWVRNIGLAFAPSGQRDRFASGFLMKKHCSTATNAASFGLIRGAEGGFLNTADALGFDFKDSNGGFLAHCSAGAPRFNVSMTDGFHFIGGCGNGVQVSPSPRGTGWTQVRFDPQDAAQAFPPVSPSATIISIALVFDEGADSGTSSSPEIVLDNIVVNGNMAVAP